MQRFDDVIAERASRERSLHLEITSPRCTGDDMVTLQDLIKVYRILQHHNCNNDIICPADLGLPIQIEMNGHLLTLELRGDRVRSKQVLALADLCNSHLDVTAYFAEGDRCYMLGRDLAILQIMGRGVL